MNKRQWLSKIRALKREGSNFCSLNWSAAEWQRWDSGNLTRDQKAMVVACQILNVLPEPGSVMGTNTIWFSGLL